LSAKTENLQRYVRNWTQRRKSVRFRK